MIRIRYMVTFAILWAFIAVSEGGEPSYSTWLRFCANTDGRSAVTIKPSDVAACRFTVSSKLTGISVECPSYNNNVGDLTFSIYHWKKDYPTTIAGKKLFSKKFVNFTDNAILSLEFKPLSAGEYLWTLDNARELVGVWKFAGASEEVTTFFNGLPTNGIYSFNIQMSSHGSFPFVGDMKTYHSILNKTTAPSEPKLAPDSAIVTQDVQSDTWDAIDELDRVLPNKNQAGPLRAEKQVGIFYWTWHSPQFCTTGPFDNTKITTEHPDAVGNLNHPAWGPVGTRHHWGEPLFGYYTTQDEWIHRKHAEMLANAGIDAIIFDATNGELTWMDSVKPLMKVYDQARRDGVKTPKFAFMLPFSNLKWTATDLVQLWRDIYRDGLYQDLWFYWDGKPLVYGMPDAIDQLITKAKGAEKEELLAIRSFFSFRPGQPAYTGGPRRPDQWSWLEVYPQHGYGVRSDGTFDMISVGVAQNHSSKKFNGQSGLAAMNDQNVFGRAYIAGKPRDTRPNADLYGGNFQQQWSRAFDLDPRFVFITGWNEWIAVRVADWLGTPNAFPDQYNEPFSRDTEPSRGRLMDNYYMQLISNVRRFKGVHPQQGAGPKKSFELTDITQADWTDVTPVYRDYRGDTVHRDASGYGKTRYINDSGRNDIVLAKVTRDNKNLYFLVETANDLTPVQGTNWMRLFLATSDSWKPKTKKENWEHFDFYIEQTTDGAVLKRSTSGWNWKTVCPVTRRIKGKRLEVSVPLDVLGLESNKIDLHFKWSDNMRVDGDILDFYQFGDTAPDGRFTYRFFTE